MYSLVPPVCERANYNTLCTNYPLQWWNWMASFSTWDESEKKEKRLRNLNICFLQCCCSHGIHDKLELKVFFTPLWAFEKKLRQIVAKYFGYVFFFWEDFVVFSSLFSSSHWKDEEEVKGLFRLPQKLLDFSKEKFGPNWAWRVYVDIQNLALLVRLVK